MMWSSPPGSLPRLDPPTMTPLQPWLALPPFICSLSFFLGAPIVLSLRPRHCRPPSACLVLLLFPSIHRKPLHLDPYRRAPLPPAVFEASESNKPELATLALCPRSRNDAFPRPNLPRRDHSQRKDAIFPIPHITSLSFFPTFRLRIWRFDRPRPPHPLPPRSVLSWPCTF